jgi:hypothetical protein
VNGRAEMRLHTYDLEKIVHQPDSDIIFAC